jgi:hypothetical protein
MDTKDISSYFFDYPFGEGDGSRQTLEKSRIEKGRIGRKPQTKEQKIQASTTTPRTPGERGPSVNIKTCGRFP